MMGSPEGENGHLDDEGPQHAVTIAKSFAVGKFDVLRNGMHAPTQALVRACWTVAGDAVTGP